MLNGELSTYFNKLIWFCNGDTSFGYRPARRGKRSARDVSHCCAAAVTNRAHCVAKVTPVTFCSHRHTAPTLSTALELGVPADIASGVSLMMNTSSSRLSLIWLYEWCNHQSFVRFPTASTIISEDTF